MPRPKRRSAEVLESTAKRIFPRLLKWLDTEESTERELAELVEAISWSTDENGYEIARFLDRMYGWSPDAELVELLDNVGIIIAGIEAEKVADWVKANNITLRYKIGDVIDLPKSVRVPAKFRMDAGDKPIKIHGLYPKTAEYSITYDGNDTKYWPIIAAELVQPPELLPIDSIPSIPDSTGNSLEI